VHLVVVTVEDSDGARGIGFSWTPQIGALAIHALIANDAATAVVGGPVAPEVVWDRLWGHLHEGGGGGITTMAMAAIDIALWDRRGKVLGRSLVELIGRRHERVPVYGSGINFHYALDELEAQVERWVAAGLRAVKIKVGHPDLDEDLERVAAVRRILGPRRKLMVDANQRWELPAARRATRALERYEPDLLEEPLLADDLRAHRELRRSTPIPIALGENLYTAYQFREALRLGACDIVQPNVVRVGGITPFLRIAEQSRTAGAAVMPHLLVDLSGQLALCLPGPPLVEHVEDASFEALGILARPSGVHIADGTLSADTGPGHGLTFALERSERLA
jgi:L-alanine-DL-glutamate epimerase-like enolase superfamily enzyme